jgi:hypothetical protein
MNINWRSLAAATALALGTIPAFADDGGGKFALTFRSPTVNSSVPGALAGTPPGSPITQQTDNVRLQALVNWAGPPNRGGILIYNGHGCCSGWGLLILGYDSGPDAGKLAVLAGGITVAVAPLSLTPGVWTYVTADRRAGDVTITIQGTGRHDVPQTFDMGVIPVNPIGVNNNPVSGGTVRTTERFSIGENLNGIMDNVKMMTLDTKQLVDSWTFKKVTGFSAVGANGNTIDLQQSVTWIDLNAGDGEDDD